MSPIVSAYINHLPPVLSLIRFAALFFGKQQWTLIVISDLIVRSLPKYFVFIYQAALYLSTINIVVSDLKARSLLQTFFFIYQAALHRDRLLALLSCLSNNDLLSCIVSCGFESLRFAALFFGKQLSTF